MGMLAQISDAVNAAFAEYKKEFGENAQITDGTEFVTVFNNCALIVRAEGDTLKTEFIGGKPYQVDMSLAIYDEVKRMDRFKLTKQDRINQYKIIMYNVKGDLECYTRPNIVRRLDKMGFFDAPASINHHGAYSGALFDHSLAVTGALLDYTDKMGLTWSNARSPYIVGMFHDLCKCDNYKVVDGKWKYNPNMILPGHGEKSIIMLQNIAPDALTNEEIACIRWHMGAFDDRNNWEYYTRAVAKFPNVMYTHAADMAAAYIVGV